MIEFDWLKERVERSLYWLNLDLEDIIIDMEYSLVVERIRITEELRKLI